MSDDRLATLACQRGNKKELCVCEPCQARRRLFGDNIPCQIQELRRAALASGKIKSLKEALVDTKLGESK